MSEKSWLDISQPLTNDIAVWPGDIPFNFELGFTKEQTESVNIGQIKVGVHTGTHGDAPFHFNDEGKTIDEIDINVYIGKAKVIDVAGFPLIDQYVLEKMELNNVERILFKTNPNRDPKTFPDTFTVFDPSAAKYLKKLGVVLIGTDAPSVDPEHSKSLKAHHAFHENDIFILENLLLNEVQPGDYELIALPLKIVGADGSPVRAVIRPI